MHSFLLTSVSIAYFDLNIRIFYISATLPNKKVSQFVTAFYLCHTKELWPFYSLWNFALFSVGFGGGFEQTRSSQRTPLFKWNVLQPSVMRHCFLHFGMAAAWDEGWLLWSLHWVAVACYLSPSFPCFSKIALKSVWKNILKFDNSIVS